MIKVFNMHIKTNRIVFSGLLIACFLFSLNLTTNSASAFSASITTNSSINLNVSPTGDGTSIHSEFINVTSDCRSGYNLTIATPSGSNLYKYDNNTQSSTTASFTAVDGTSALNSTNNTNKWGYTLDSNPTSSTVFSPLSTTASVLRTSSQTASADSDINDTFNINYGIKVDSNITPGNYQMASQGAVVYYLTMDTTCAQYTVSFNPNGGTLASGITNPEQNIQAGEPTKLISSDSLKAPQGTSYTDADNNTITGDNDKLWTFWGWNTQADGTGDWYKDRESVEDLANAGSTITLYAQWKQATLADMTAAPSTEPTDPKQISHDEMQDISPEACYNSTAYSTNTSSDAHNPYDSSTNPNGYHTITLLDKRGKVTTGETPEAAEQYTISKLPDNNCWMTKNLNLGRTGTEGPNSDGTITLTPDDTDLAENTTFTVPVSTNSLLTTNNTTSYTTPLLYKNSTYGVYYTWATALASTTNYSTSGTNVTTSICPRSWDLPTRYQYDNLKTKAGLTTSNAYSAPFNFYKAGYKNGTSAPASTTAVYLWTSTSGGTPAYYSSATANATTASYNKRMGYNIRCIASNGTITINYDGNSTTEHPVTGTTASQESVEINSVNTRANGFTRTSWAFNGWNTAADGTGTAIAVNTAITNLNPTPGSTITLYAQWLPQRQIIYNDNCSYNNAGCATSTDTTNTSSWTKAGRSITLGSDSYFTTRPGYAITSWNTAKDGSGTSYNISSSYIVPSTLTAPDQVTLYAQWSPALTINFNNNGGSGAMTSQLIPENASKALKNNSFTAPPGNYFIGWMTEESRANNEIIYANGATYTTPTTVTPGDSITLYAKWGPRYTIVYDGNNATGGSMISSSTELKHTNINEGSTVDLYAPNYWKTGFGFVGWSLSPTATVGGTDPIYGPNESILAPDYDKYGEEISGTKTITLYAIWLEADSTKTMQTFTTSDCQNLSQTTFISSTGKITAPAGSVIALKDQRDNNVYTVARLADGKCWMTENLRLEAENTVGNNQYNSSVTNESLSQGYGGVFTGLDSSENANFSNVTTATPNNLYNSTNITGSYTGYRFPRYNNNNTKTSLTARYDGTGSSTHYSWYSYGNYYNWAAAMANTTHYGSATGTSGSESADTSICPTNWTLPTSGTTTKDFGTLSRSYDGSGENQSGTGTGDVMSNRFRTFPNNFLYSGYFGVNGSFAYYRGSAGNYWSRSASSNDVYSYSLYLSATNLGPSYYLDKDEGFTVRCLIGS